MLSFGYPAIAMLIKSPGKIDAAGDADAPGGDDAFGRHRVTAQLVQVAFNELTRAGIETELVELAGTHPWGCINCRQCFARKDRRRAVISDAMNEWIAKMRDKVLAKP